MASAGAALAPAGAAAAPFSRLLPFGMVFGGCMSAIIAMEYVLQSDRGAGNFLTLTEFTFVLVQSLPERFDFQSRQWKSLKMPWSCHAQHALLWVSMSILANFVFGYNISVPLFTLFRSCNVIASMCLGWLAFGQRYSLQQIACVVVITTGIFLGSIGDSRRFRGASACTDCTGVAAGAAEGASTGESGLLRWSIGVTILVLVQAVQAYLGHAQANWYSRFEQHGSRSELSEEFLFTAHVVSLFPLLLLWDDIAAAVNRALHSPPLWPSLPIPGTLAWIMLNNLFQAVCIKGVFRLAAHHSPLTVNITLSVRKFLSVVISILWFGNAWTHLHSVATVAIFGGVFAYSQCEGLPPKKKLE